jgi:hypothetical protein
VLREEMFISLDKEGASRAWRAMQGVFADAEHPACPGADRGLTSCDMKKTRKETHVRVTYGQRSRWK